MNQENIERFGVIYLTSIGGKRKPVTLKNIDIKELEHLVAWQNSNTDLTRLTERIFGAEVSFCVEELPSQIMKIIEYHDEYFSDDIRGFLSRNNLVAVKGEKF